MSDIQEILSQNKDKNFVKRILFARDYPKIQNNDKTVSTHKMAWGEADGKYVVYPTIVHDERSNTLKELPAKDAARYALQNKEYITFDNADAAKSFSEGGYKQGFDTGRKVTGNALGYPIRELHPSEDEYFKKNTHVGGMAAEDGHIILNPYSKLKPEEKDAVARNEAARLYMRENNIVPNFAVSPEQRDAFKGTEYGKPENEKFLKQTLAARLVSGDPSAGKATEEQMNAAKEILNQMRQRATTTR